MRGDARLARAVALALAVASVAGAPGGLAHAAEPGPGRSLLLGDPAPALAVQDLAGKSVALQDFRGQALVVQFFATWCAPCHRAWEDLEAVLAETAKPAGATTSAPRPRVLMISMRETKEAVETHSRSSGMAPAAGASPTGIEAVTTVALDPDGRAAARWGADRLPTIFIMDDQGIVRHINRGWGPGYRARLRHWLARTR
jgi:thiol-disulfide isomerase/thioredoxin